MSVTIESDLKEILTKIDQKLDTLSRDVTDLKVGQARLEEKVDGLEKRLESKLDGLSKRLDNQEFLSRGVLIGLIVAILGSFAKLFGFVGVQ
ncbi:MAG: hemolysin XhlA family protein [Aphanothece sp. CMT-3BRIN-NPC111]|nr:hemolysin XhlA family protein [Aphanothece sp. CMT-3BRIN-NPC111]